MKHNRNRGEVPAEDSIATLVFFVLSAFILAGLLVSCAQRAGWQ